MKLKSVLIVAGGLLLAGMSVVGCGEGGGAKSANITPGDMPDGESWTGVFFHPTYGYLHLVEQDTNVVGKWQRTDKSAWGQLSGTKTGNVLHFSWTEHKYGMVGPSATVSGRGYFVYKKTGRDPGARRAVRPGRLGGRLRLAQREAAPHAAGPELDHRRHARWQRDPWRRLRMRN